MLAASRLLAGLLLVTWETFAAPPLPAFRVDADHVSVSGLSSGAFMAVQLHVAYSRTFRAGVGVVAGGAFACAQDRQAQALGACMAPQSVGGVPPLGQLVAQARAWAAAGEIDDLTNLAGTKAWLFTGGRADVGTRDTTVNWRVVDQARDFYATWVPGIDITYKSDLRTEHGMPTDSAGRRCDTHGDPFILDCGFDAAGALLDAIHGPLRHPGSARGASRLLEFDQVEFLASPTSHGLSSRGYAYVPPRCASGAVCKLHVALHGCRQHAAHRYFDEQDGAWVTFGDRFAREAGYNRWAEANDMIVLYPQAHPLPAGRQGKSNPNGCWDWWGYDDERHARQAGRQMAAVKAMVDRAMGRTHPPAREPCTAFTANNVLHVLAGRATTDGFFAYARGTRQPMGWFNALVTTTLARTAPDRYAVGACPSS